MNNLYKIRTKVPGFEGKTVMFRPNFAQKQIYQKLSDGYRRIIILKPRKLGTTTSTVLYLLDEAMFNPNNLCRTIAHRKQTSSELFNDIVRYAFDRIREEMGPGIRYTTRSELDFADSGSDTRGRLIYTHGTDLFKITTAGTTALTIDSSQRVGIGTTSPRGLVHLHSSSSPRLDFTNTTTGTGSGDGSTISVDGSTGALNIIQRESQPIQFYASNTERMRLHSGGTLSVPTGIELGSGLDGTSANTLDDYEEGTFSVTIIGSNTVGSATYGNQAGVYTKIGRLVTCYINVSLTNKGGMAGLVRISGLPFNVDDVITGTGVDGGGFLNYYANIDDSDIVGLMLLPDQNTDDAMFYFQKTGVSMGGLEPADIDNNFNFRAVLTYCHG